MLLKRQSSDKWWLELGVRVRGWVGFLGPGSAEFFFYFYFFFLLYV